MASGTWAVDANGNWSLATNWASSVIADGASAAADFTNNITAARTVTLDTTSRTVGTVTLADPTSSFFGWVLATSGGAILTLDNGASVPTLTVDNAASTISAPLAGTNGFTKLGAQALTLTGTNTVTGTVTVTGGTLTSGANGTTGDFGAAANNIVVGTGATASVNRSNAYQIDGSITGAGTFSKVTGTGTLTLTNSTISVSTLTHSAGTVVFPTAGQTVSSAIGGAGAITISAPGTVTFSGAGANTGAWAVNAGATLNVTAAQTGATGAITVASGATLTGAGAIRKPVTISAGSTGNNFTVGGASTITVAGTATVAGAAGATNTVSVSATGNATLSGNFATISSALGSTVSTTATVSGTSSTLLGTVNVLGGSITGNTNNLGIGSAAGTTKLYLSSGTIQTVGNVNFYASDNAAASTAIYQTGGTIYGSDITSSGNLQALGWGYTGLVSASQYIYHKNTAGTVSTASNGQSGWAFFGQGVVDFGDSSTLTMALGSLLLARGNGANTIINFIGTGSTLTSGALRLGWSSATTTASSIAVLTVDGSTYNAGSLILPTINTNATHAINILSAGRINFSSATITTTAASRAINLQGGVLGITSPFLLNFPVRLYGAGNRISGGAVATGVLGAAIEAATGSGVSSVAITGGGTNYIGAPVVYFSGGGGSGATARCVYDITTSTITDIIVTCPGVGYTTPPTLTFTGGGAGAVAPTYTVALAANTPDGAIEKIESGTLALTGTNTNTGTYTISNGTLRIGNAGATGTLGNNDASNAVVASGATLAFGRNDARTYSGTISDAGTIAVNGGARATLSGTNTFTSAAAAIAISTANSILRLTNNDSIGQGSSFGITVPTLTALELDGTSGNLTGLPAKALTLSSSGTTAAPNTGGLRNIAGNNTYSGAIQLSGTPRINSDAGTLTLSSATAIFGAPLVLGGSGDIGITPRLNLGASNAVTKDGAGFADLAYSAAEDMTLSALTVSAGTLGYRTTSALSSGTCSVAGNATAANAGGLRFTGSVAKNVSRVITISGTGTGLVARFESSGSAAVTHSTAFISANTNAGQTRTYQFGGIGTADNTVSFLIAANGSGAGTITVNKADAGRWVLTNTSNSYTGGTTVTGGTLVLSIATWASGAKVTGTGGVSVSAGAKIQTRAGSGGSAQLGRHTYPSLTFAANSRIRIGG